MTAARILVTVNEMNLFNIFLVLLVKTDCMMVSKMGATWIKIGYYMILLNIVAICLVTRSVTARVSEPIADCSYIDIGPLVHPYRSGRIAASRWRNVRWNHKPSIYLSFHIAAPSHEYYVQLRSHSKNKS